MVKRRYKRSKRKNRYEMSLYRNPTVVPDSKLVRHRYCTYLTLDAGVGTSNRNIYRANSMFDPDQTGVGHQPLGFDQWSTFYDHYLVLGAKCTAHFTSTTATGTIGPQIVGIILTDNVASLPSPTTIMEQNNSNYKILTGLNAGQTQVVTCKYSPKKFFGMADLNDNRNLIGALTTTNPQEDAYFSVYTAGINNTADPADVHVLVTIEYLVQYTERKTLAQS